MKVILLQAQRYDGKVQEKDSVLNVKDVLAQDWIYKGVADVYSKKTVCKPNGKQDSANRGASGSKKPKDSKGIDGQGFDNEVQDERA